MVLDNGRDYQQVESQLPGTGVSRMIITSRRQMPALAVFHQARPLQLEPFGDEAVEFLSQRLSPSQLSDARDDMMRLEVEPTTGCFGSHQHIITYVRNDRNVLTTNFYGVTMRGRTSPLSY